MYLGSKTLPIHEVLKQLEEKFQQGEIHHCAICSKMKPQAMTKRIKTLCNGFKKKGYKTSHYAVKMPLFELYLHAKMKTPFLTVIYVDWGYIISLVAKKKKLFHAVVENITESKTRSFLRSWVFNPISETPACSVAKYGSKEIKPLYKKFVPQHDEIESFVTASIKRNKGILFFHDHGDLMSYFHIANLMPILKQNGVNCFFVEFFVDDIALFERFNRNKDVKMLMYHVKSWIDVVYKSLDPKARWFMKKSFRVLFSAAKKHDILILPVDGSTENAYLIKLRNTFIASKIQEHLKSSKSKKFAGLFGIAHTDIANLVGVPSLRFICEIKKRKTERLYKHLNITPDFTKTINSIAYGFGIQEQEPAQIFAYFYCCVVKKRVVDYNNIDGNIIEAAADAIAEKRNSLCSFLCSFFGKSCPVKFLIKFDEINLGSGDIQINLQFDKNLYYLYPYDFMRKHKNLNVPQMFFNISESNKKMKIL